MDGPVMAEAPPMPDANMTLDGMDDDLFGDAGDALDMSVALPPLPPIALPAALVLRLADEMHRTGCCTKLAWSNTGSIAQISGDGREIAFRVVIREQSTGLWKLSDASKHPLVAPDGRRFVHIQHNGFGIDLAAVDDLGTIHLYALSGALGRLLLSPSEVQSSDALRSPFDAIVGLHWLPLFPAEFRSLYITPSIKMDDRWATRTKGGDNPSARMHHPAEGRNALLHVSRSGRLSLLYQNESAVWQSIVSELEPANEDQALISHAAFGANNDHLLLVTYNHVRELMLYRILIHWNITHQTRADGNFSTVSPSVDVGRLTKLDHVAPRDSDVARLSHLSIVPIPSEVTEVPAMQPTVVAVFTHAAMSTRSTQQHSVFSVISRWNVGTIIPTLHESFSRLKSSGSSTSQKQVVIQMMRQPDILSAKLIVSVEAQYFNTIIAFAASDGTIDFRDRSRFETIESYNDNLTVSSFAQSGLEHISGEQNTEVALSADGSGLACTRPDGSIHVKVMMPRYGWRPLEDGITDTKSLVEQAVVCLARQYAILVCSSATNNEILAMLPTDSGPDLRTTFTKETFRVMNRSPDFSLLDQAKQQQMVVKEPFMPRILSAQLTLGTSPGTTRRAFAGQMAYVLLNLRHVSMALAQTLSRDLGGRLEVLPSLAGIVKWASDLMIYVIKNAKTVLEDAAAGGDFKQAIERFVAKTDSPAVHLLLCSFSRTLLRFIPSYVAMYLRMVPAARPKVRSVLDVQQLTEAYELAKSLPFSFPAFLDLINEVDQSIRNTYTEGNISAERRGEIELAMITEGTLPDELQPVFQALSGSSLPKLLESTDTGKLYFWDTEWLGIADTAPAQKYDAMKKTPMHEGMQIRVCRRCAACMEDMSSEQVRQSPQWLASASRHCICLDYWWIPN